MARQIRRLYRSSRNAMLGGVCGGLAEYLGVDAALVRLVYVVVSVASVAFPGILVYIIAWLVIPRDF